MSSAAWIGQARGSLARRRAGKRLMLGDGVVYQPGDNQTNGNRRLDAKVAILPFLHELDDLIEERYQGRTVRVKNTSGGAWAAGTLLAPPLTGAVTTPSSNVATSSPSAGTSVVITVAGTYAVGQLVTVTTTGILTGSLDLVDKTYVSATGSGTITVDQLDNNHTLPTVDLDSAINAVVAVASTGIPAEWVTSASIANGAYGDAHGCVEVTGLDTSGYSAAGVAVYLGAAGAGTGTAPTRTTTNVSQVVGLVKVKDASVGIIKFFPVVKRCLWLPSGVGTVTASGGSLTSNAVVLGAGTTDVKVVTGIITDGTSKITVGLAGTVAGGIVFANATSGSITVVPPSGALGTVTLTLPAVTDTLVGLAATQTLTNKSIVATQLTGTVADARLSANVPLLNVANSFVTGQIVTGSLQVGNSGNLGALYAAYSNGTPYEAWYGGYGFYIADDSEGFHFLSNNSVNTQANAAAATDTVLDRSGVGQLRITNGSSSDRDLKLRSIIQSGTITISGASSGTCVLGVAAAAGTGTIFTLPATNGTNGYFLKTDGAGVTSWAASGGTVTNTGGNLTSNAIVLGAGTVDTKVVTGIRTDGTAKVTAGLAGTSDGSFSLENTTSGSITLAPTAGALGTSVHTFMAGNGLQTMVVSRIRSAGNTGSVALVSYTVGSADATFLVSANVLVTTATVHNFTVTCVYTDEGNTSRTLVLAFSSLAGAFLTNIINTAGAVPYEGVPVHIRAKAGTTITVRPDSGGTYTTVVYNAEAYLTQIGN